MTPLTESGLDERSQQLLFTEARTATTFAATPVSDDQLRSAWELARWAPSTMNSQPLRVTFVRTPEAKARVVAHLKPGNRSKTESAPVVAILSYDLDFHDNLPHLFPKRGAAERDHLEGDAGLREETARYSAAFQSGVFLLAVRAVGLSAGPMAGFDPQGIDAEFHAGTSWRSHLLVNIGYPALRGRADRPPRLDSGNVVAWG